MKKNNTSFFGKLKNHTQGFQLGFIVAIILAIVSAITTVIGPEKLKEITNLIVEGIKINSDGTFSNIDIDKVVNIAIFLTILYSISALAGYAQSFIIATIVQKFSNRLRKLISKKINSLPLKYFDSHSQGDTLSRVTNDVDTASQSLNQSLSPIISSTILILGAVFMMIKTNFTMAMTAIGSVFIGFALSVIIMISSQKIFKKQQTNLALVNGYIEEIYSGHNVVTSYNAINQSSNEFNKLNSKLHKTIWKSQFISGIMMPMMIFIGNFGYVMVCVVGAILVIDGKITIGHIVAFMTYVRIFSQPLSQLAQAGTQMQSASAAMGRIFEFLEEKDMQDDSDKKRQLDHIKGNVEFKNVSFGYSEEKTIIHNFTAKANAGQKIAIVGPTGAGKTTIVNLLMKFYEINKGAIEIDGVDIKNMSRAEIHDAFSMVLQDTWLFEGSVRDNLVYNQKNISDEDVKKATKAVGVHHYIKTLPNGYDTILNDANSLSVGQRQLITIARSLLKNSPLLILDEATSSVDTRTEQIIQNAMDTLMKGRTSFVIAHRLSTIKNADLILVMREGNIIEQGNHDELIEQNGFYAELYNSQFEEGEEE
ncbi:ABC transporter ATP-binding protein [Gemella sp. zg-1178]|uniref:ABC transporter ATP-binding protein n=1 Tax=Gemella sp. zg-1178 TaxID=2840372 RepID=UPI001C04C7B3|nr:ABC transporter ATP-binding protein [Gemella sp. zg-1178]MBU0278211.1 ABC transporter ATP-binding protein/permease [Gemella sp. zg-1178]